MSARTSNHTHTHMHTQAQAHNHTHIRVVKNYLTFDLQNAWLLTPFDSIKETKNKKGQNPKIMAKGPPSIILLSKKYKGFSKFIKEKCSEPTFQFLNFKTIV